MQSPAHDITNKVLILRLNRLSHLPPAVYETQLLVESGAEIVVCEFSPTPPNAAEGVNFPTWSIWPRYLSNVPRKLRGLALVFYATLKIFWRMRKQRPCLMVAHGIQEQWIARVLNIFFKIPYVVHVHEAYEKSELTTVNKFFFAFEGTALRHAKFLIFPEAERAKIYTKRYRIKCPVYLTYNCPRLRSPTLHTPLRVSLGLDPDSKLLLYMGGIGPTNVLMELLEAIKDLPRVVVLLAGWGDVSYVTELKVRIAALGLNRQVFFLGTVLPEDKWKYLDQVDGTYCVYRPMYLRLRHAATASNKLMESLAAGVPTLTSDQPDFRSLVESLDVGVCVDFTPPAIKHGIEQLLFDEVASQRRKKNAIQSHRASYHFERQFQGALTAFQELIATIPAWPQEKAAKSK